MKRTEPLTRHAAATALTDLLQLPHDALDEATGLFELFEDSFQLVEVVVGLQQQVGVQLTQEDLASCRTVRDLLDRLTDGRQSPRD